MIPETHRKALDEMPCLAKETLQKSILHSSALKKGLTKWNKNQDKNKNDTQGLQRGSKRFCMNVEAKIEEKEDQDLILLK